MNKIYNKYQEEIIFSLSSILPFSVFLILDYFFKFDLLLWSVFTFVLSIFLLLIAVIFERPITTGFCKFVVVITSFNLIFSIALSSLHS